MNVGHAAVVRDIRRLTGPGRDGPETRYDDKLLAPEIGRQWFAIGQHCFEFLTIVVVHRRLAVNEVTIAARDPRDSRMDLFQL